jgi:hypothetical protein
MKIGRSRAFAKEFRAAAERERRISLAIGHLETDHRRSVFFLERFYLAARFDHDHAQGPAIKGRAALDNGIDNAFGLIEGNGSHGGRSSSMLCQLPSRDSIPAMRRFFRLLPSGADRATSARCRNTRP